MRTRKIVFLSFLHALGVMGYIWLVVGIMRVLESRIREVGQVPGLMMFLLLLTLSAAIVGILIFGRPVYWFLTGLKSEALKFLAATLSFLVIAAFVFFVVINLAAK